MDPAAGPPRPVRFQSFVGVAFASRLGSVGCYWTPSERSQLFRQTEREPLDHQIARHFLREHVANRWQTHHLLESGNFSHHHFHSRFSALSGHVNPTLVSCAAQVHVQLGNARQGDDDEEDLEGSGGSDASHPAPTTANTNRYVIIPIQCHSELNFPMGQAFGNDDADDDNVMVKKGEIYLFVFLLHS